MRSTCLHKLCSWCGKHTSVPSGFTQEYEKAKMSKVLLCPATGAITKVRSTGTHWKWSAWPIGSSQKVSFSLSVFASHIALQSQDRLANRAAIDSRLWAPRSWQIQRSKSLAVARSQCGPSRSFRLWWYVCVCVYYLYIYIYMYSICLYACMHACMMYTWSYLMIWYTVYNYKLIICVCACVYSDVWKSQEKHIPWIQKIILYHDMAIL